MDRVPSLNNVEVVQEGTGSGYGLGPHSSAPRGQVGPGGFSKGVIHAAVRKLCCVMFARAGSARVTRLLQASPVPRTPLAFGAGFRGEVALQGAAVLHLCNFVRQLGLTHA